MGLSPDEEDAFVAIVAGLAWPGASRIPWSIVGVSLVVVGNGVAAAVLLGLALRLAVAFSLSFVLGLATGLVAIGISDRRARARG